MKSKMILTIAGIAGALTLTLSGCGLIGIGGGASGSDVKEETTKAITETSVADTSKEAASENDNDKKEEETQKSEDKASEAGEAADENEASPEAVTGDSVSGDTNEPAAHLEELKAEADRIAKEEQARVDEYNRQQEEYKKQLAEQQEEYNRQIEAQREENRKKIEQYNAEIEAYNKRMNNYYYNTNHTELINDVNINPGHIIYDSNGDLYATCYISNGKNTPVYDILVDYIELYGNDGNLIARDENVRIGNGGAIGGHMYNTWTFVFSGDKVKQSAADLTKTIGCKLGVAYRF